MGKKENDSGFTFDSFEEVADGINSESPDPNEAAIAEHAAETQQQAAASGAKTSTSALVDSAGVRFDENAHATNAQGEPSLTPLGKFRKKKGASKVATQSQGTIDEAKKREARAAGYLAADMMISSSVMLLGNEWMPVGSTEYKPGADFNEHEHLRRAFGDYFEAKNLSDFPPSIALSIALSGYILPRVATGPETKTRLAKLKFWVSDKFDSMKRKRKNAAQSDTRDNGKRENDASKKAGGAEQTERTRNPRT